MQIKVGSKILTTIDQTDLKCLDNDLLDKEEWFKNAILGKINNCKKRLFRQWIPKLREKGLSIPATDAEFVDLIISQPEYKNRQQREKEKPNSAI